MADDQAKRDEMQFEGFINIVGALQYNTQGDC